MPIENHCSELGVLLLSGQLDPSDRTALEGHLSVCEDCRTEFSDIALIVAEITSLADKSRPGPVSPGLTERFVARARTEGIPLSSPSSNREVTRSRSRNGNLFALLAVAALVLLAVGVRMINLSTWDGFSLHRASQPSLPILSPPGPAEVRASQGDEIVRDRAKLQIQVQSLEKDIAALTARLRLDQQALAAAKAETIGLTSDLKASGDEAANLRKGIADRDSQVAELARNVEKLQSLKDSDTLAFKIEETELSNLRDQVSKLNVKLQESEQLSAAANQAKDLIVARHLHIVDVDDTDENGKQQKPFGRIFYTEGKKLVFYAYDLSDPRRFNAKINFYVWGGREGLTKPIKSLGIFHSDDVSAGRWVLQFDDPSVLAQINCVWVTAESAQKTITQPSGKQLLFASLGKTINHP